MFQQRRNVDKANVFKTYRAPAEGANVNIMYDAFTKPKYNFVNIEGKDVKDLREEGLKEDLFISCPSGYCNETVTINPKKGSMIKTINVSHLVNDVYNWSFTGISAGKINLRQLNLTKYGSKWTNATINLTQGPDYCLQGYGGVPRDAFRCVYTNGTLVGFKNNESEYAIFALLKAPFRPSGESFTQWQGIISKRPYMGDEVAIGNITYAGVRDNETVGTNSYVRPLQGLQNTVGTYSCYEKKLSNTSIRYTCEMTPRWLRGDSKVDAQYFQVYAEGKRAGSTATTINYSGAPGILVNTEFQSFSYHSGLGFPAGIHSNLDFGTLRPGETGRDIRLVRNIGNTPINFNVSATDFINDNGNRINITNSKLKSSNLWGIRATPTGPNLIPTHCSSWINRTLYNYDQAFQTYPILPEQVCRKEAHWIGAVQPNFIYFHVPLRTPPGNYTNTFTFSYNEKTETIKGEVEVLSPIRANVDIDPDILNLKSKGKWVTAYIETPGYNVSKINISSVSINETIPAIDNSKYEFVKNPQIKDRDGYPELSVKFSRRSLQDIVTTGKVTLIINGKLGNYLFRGNETITVRKN